MPVCPEHAHWQERMDTNVLAISEPFEEVMNQMELLKPGSEERERERGDRDQTLVERDINIDGLRNRGKR